MGYRRQFELRWQIAMEQQQRQSQFPELRPPPVVPPPMPPMRLEPAVAPFDGSAPTLKGKHSDRWDRGSTIAEQAGMPGPLSSDIALGSWTVDEVCSWATGLKLPADAVGILRDEAVSGRVLPSLSEADMLQMGIAKLGHRRQLVLAVKDELLKNNKVTTNGTGLCVSKPSSLVVAQRSEHRSHVSKEVSSKTPAPSTETNEAPPPPSNEPTKEAACADEVSMKEDKSSAASILREASKIRKTMKTNTVDFNLAREASEEATEKAEVRPDRLCTEELIYSLCDPFEVEETAMAMSAHSSLVASAEASQALSGVPSEMDDEALMYAMLDPNEMPCARKTTSCSSAARARSVTFHEDGQDEEEENLAEYWQDVTAFKAAQRRKSQLRLSLCSRRGVGRGGIDVDEPPEIAQAKAREEEEEEQARWDRIKAKDGDEPNDENKNDNPSKESEDSGSEGEPVPTVFRRTGKSIWVDEASISAVKSLRSLHSEAALYKVDQEPSTAST